MTKWEQDVPMLKKYAGIKTTEEIGVILGRSTCSVASYAAKAGISLKRYGENHRDAKLSNLQVQMLHALSDAGFETGEIRKACFPHVSTGCIYEIKNMNKRING